MFDVSDKTRNISSQLVLQQCCNTSCMFFVAHSSVPSKVPKGVTKPRLNDQTFSFNMVSEKHDLPLSRFSQNFFSISFDVSSNIFAYHKQMSDCLATAFCAWQLKTIFGENVWSWGLWGLRFFLVGKVLSFMRSSNMQIQQSAQVNIFLTWMKLFTY